MESDSTMSQDPVINREEAVTYIDNSRTDAKYQTVERLFDIDEQMSMKMEKLLHNVLLDAVELS